MDYKEISPKKRISHVERNAGISTSLVKHKKSKRDGKESKNRRHTMFSRPPLGSNDSSYRKDTAGARLNLN